MVWIQGLWKKRSPKALGAVGPGVWWRFRDSNPGPADYDSQPDSLILIFAHNATERWTADSCLRSLQEPNARGNDLSRSDIERIPTREDAQRYVKSLVFGRGGAREALRGVWSKTLPRLAGFEQQFTPRRFIAFALRVILVLAIAVYPLLLRKTLFPHASGEASQSFVGPSAPDPTYLEAVQQIWRMISSPHPIDWVLACIAIVLTATPKLADRLGKRDKPEMHVPHYKLSAAIDALPGDPCNDPARCDEAIKMTLQALKEEMLQVSDDEGGHRLTDVTLLEFCDPTGKKMRVRARTATHEATGRSIASEQLMAYYVAMLGRSVAEHDFTNRKNPFPPVRLSVVGRPAVPYKSVLFLPIIRGVKTNGATGEVAPDGEVSDYCLGVVCVHSVRPYWFWRWGDHKKTTGGFADVATDRALPYIAFLTHLVSGTAHRVLVEVK
jgi:hypothetical protein